MVKINDWKQANSNISFPQGGDHLVLGARSGVPTRYEWQDLRNLFGANSAQHISLFEDFLGVAADTPAPFVDDFGSTGTATVANSALALLTAATGDDWSTVALGTHWTISNGWTFFEARFKVNAITTVGFEVGLSDAVSETAGVAFSDHSVAGVTDVATNAIVFAFDTADTMTNIALNYSNDGTPGAVDLGVAPVADTYVSVRLEINEDGDVNVYVNGSFVTSVTAAIDPSATVGPWLTVLARTTSARTLSVDYVAVSGNR